MKRLLPAVALALAAIPSPSVAQKQAGWGDPRPGVVDKAVADTVAVYGARRGYPAPILQRTIAYVISGLVDLDGSSMGCHQQQTYSAWSAYLRLTLCGFVPQPIQLGQPGWGDGTWKGGGGGTGGGGGASGSWGERPASDDCGLAKIEFDAEGNLVIPTYSLPVGHAYKLRAAGKPGGAPDTVKDKGEDGFVWMVNSLDGKYSQARASAKDLGAGMRRVIHLINSTRERRDWFGTVKLLPEMWCADFATVAYLDSNREMVGREKLRMCSRPLWNAADLDPYMAQEVKEHEPCPPSGSDSADFHFYSQTTYADHTHGCVWYAPRPDITNTPDGYQINPKTTISKWDLVDWPKSLPEYLKQCRLSAEYIAAVADALLKKAAKQPGYDGIPADQPVLPSDARPGDSTINDLGAKPGKTATGEPAPTPVGNPETPTPEKPPVKPETPGTTPSSGCQFGEGGCTNPGVAQPDPGDPKTDFFEPVFNWLPKMDAISLDTTNVGCPTWNIDASAFGGSDWQWTMTSHCDLIESQREAISVLFVALWGLAAALIILRT